MARAAAEYAAAQQQNDYGNTIEYEEPTYAEDEFGQPIAPDAQTEPEQGEAFDEQIEGFEGADWAINVSVRADEQGIFEGFTKDLSAPLNRDDAALLIYNALDVEMIQSYTTNNYPIVYSDHRTILSDKYGVIKVEGVVTANEWAILDDDTDTALQEGKTRIYNLSLIHI